MNTNMNIKQSDSRDEVIAKIDELIDNKWYGGIELKIENGNIDYLKSWRGQKFHSVS